MIISRRNFQKALMNAGRSTVNKMLIQGRNAAQRKIRVIYNIKAKTLKDYTIMRRATNRVPEGMIIIKGRKLPLIAFGARQVKRGTTVKVKKAGGRKLIRHAFIAEMPSGKVHVWMRRGPTRLPIEGKFTISVAGMFENQGAKEFEDLLQKKMPTTFEHELEHFMNRGADR